MIRAFFLNRPKLTLRCALPSEYLRRWAVLTDIFGLPTSSIPEVAEVTWYRQRDGILITDAHSRNFRKDTTSGALVPVDLVVTTVPAGVPQVLPQPVREWQPDLE